MEKSIIGVSDKTEEIEVKYFFNAFTPFSFKGRVTRKEFWLFTLFAGGLAILLGILLGSFYEKVETYGQLLTVEITRLIFVVLLGITNLSMQKKRLHDSGRSGNWIFVAAVPVVGTIVLIVLLCAKTQMQDNQYGAIPEIMRTKGNKKECIRETVLVVENHSNGRKVRSKGRTWNLTASAVLSVISCVAIIVAMNVQDARRNILEAISPTIIYSVLLGLNIVCLLGLIVFEKTRFKSVGKWLSLLPAMATITVLIEGSAFSSTTNRFVPYIHGNAVVVCNCVWVIASFIVALIAALTLLANKKNAYYLSVRYREKCYKRIAKLHTYLNEGIISQEEYEKARADILKKVK